MSTVLGILGALGGLSAFAGAVAVIGRSIVRQVHATEDNTKALQELSGKLGRIDATVGQHGERIARLEGTKVL